MTDIMATLFLIEYGLKLQSLERQATVNNTKKTFISSYITTSKIKAYTTLASRAMHIKEESSSPFRNGDVQIYFLKETVDCCYFSNFG